MMMIIHLLVKRKCTNVNVHVYSPDIPVGSADCTIYTPGVGTHSFIISSPLDRIQHFAAAMANHYHLAFFPPGTHHCRVDRSRGSMI